MQKVEGSNPFSRFARDLAPGRDFVVSGGVKGKWNHPLLFAGRFRLALRQRRSYSPRADISKVPRRRCSAPGPAPKPETSMHRKRYCRCPHGGSIAGPASVPCREEGRQCPLRRSPFPATSARDCTNRSATPRLRRRSLRRPGGRKGLRKGRLAGHRVRRRFPASADLFRGTLVEQDG
jgi:hypothetical protein